MCRSQPWCMHLDRLFLEQGYQPFNAEELDACRFVGAASRSGMYFDRGSIILFPSACLYLLSSFLLWWNPAICRPKAVFAIYHLTPPRVTWYQASRFTMPCVE